MASTDKIEYPVPNSGFLIQKDDALSNILYVSIINFLIISRVQSNLINALLKATKNTSVEWIKFGWQSTGSINKVDPCYPEIHTKLIRIL